ncbi:hypothetical protein GCM10022243_54840 [Saccharothrix violaceirubra]|uniref:Soluble lytic murein transglycosylase-like protein n=1 Tax=Saccharothrix violaceirubra TaxID=413306 RepID=A0A7W7T5L0_9PSEU|nr:transglycosylase SLT domain-containing protein [Saccharothrix violaceirubra]MBB4966997.1 soluble lytic murein transglycosylase-like protein [Saccharothrix violaceirubra]
MARHTKATGRTVYTAAVAPEGYRGAHRAEPERAGLASRVAAVAVAVGAVTGSGAAAAATMGPFNPLAGAADFGGLPDEPKTIEYSGKVDTVHAIDLGSETARMLKGEQLAALDAYTQASGVASSGYTARQEAAAKKAAEEAEARKSPHQRQVEGWIKEAIKVLQANGTPIDESAVDEIYTIIEKESNGNPDAINNWDSNAARGTPSKGLMQVIDPTFQSYKLAGHDDIYDPVDNIIAGVRYTYARYGGFHNHPGLVGIANGNGYQGY